MDFLKKHYEKIVLGVVLLGLAAAVALLPQKIARERADLEDKRNQVVNIKPKPLTNIFDAHYNQAYQQLEKPQSLNFSRPHNLFNPVPWQKRSDGTLIKVQTGSEIGPEALVVSKINPLFTTITFESVGASGSNYQVSVVRDAETSPRKRAKKTALLEVGAKGEFLTVQAVQGPAEKPDALVLVLTDTGEKISLTADKPFQRVDGYSADLKYDPEKRVWLARRIGDKLLFSGDEFSVVSINLIATGQFEVVVSAKSTGKKTTIRHGSDAQP